MKRSTLSQPKRSSASTGFMAWATGQSNDGEGQEATAKRSKKELPEVDIMEDPGIWVCLDEGCNSNCHGDEWAVNAEAKLAKMPIQEKKLEWVHRRSRQFNGIGTGKVTTYGKRKIPAAWMLQKSRKILPGFLESHEQKGGHPLLLSDDSQAKMRFVKDMREGVCYLKDYDDYLEIHRAKGSGLKVVCISHFPRGRITPEMFVGADPEKIRATQEVIDTKRRSVSPQHPLLVANPATVEKEATPARAAYPIVKEIKDGGQIPTITLASFGIEIAKDLDNPSPEGARISPDFSWQDCLHEIKNNADNFDFTKMSHHKALTRRFLEEHPEHCGKDVLLVDCMDMADAAHDKKLRCHPGYHPDTMMQNAGNLSHQQLDNIAHAVCKWKEEYDGFGCLIIFVCRVERH